LIGLAAAAGCRVDEQAFQARVFACDIAARDPHCGTDQDGQPMTCFPASQLDGTDFCTQSCGEPMSLLPEESAVCVQGNAKLRYCDPSDTTAAEGPCGRSDLGCLRTDVTAQEGVCMAMEPCTVDTDCPNPIRSTCAATFLKQLYPSADLHYDHLYCLQKSCVADSSACAPGQSCLRKLIPAAANPPDICVPNCDSQQRCPPNHFCYQKLTNESNPAICIPGLLGFVCETDVDCLVGKCTSDNEPDAKLRLDLCTVTCATDDDCAKFDGVQGRFDCIAGQCETPDAYRGSSCLVDSDCTREGGETVCVYDHLPDPMNKSDQGTCLRPCNADGSCSKRGSFGHGCLSFVDRGGSSVPACFPGYFGVPCLSDDNCIPNLSCRGADTTNPAAPVFGLCTTLCAGDQDCADNRFTAGQTFCAVPDAPICVPLIADGEACDKDSHCASQHCLDSPGPDGGPPTKTCSVTGGSP
jgi:hypothetical protein